MHGDPATAKKLRQITRDYRREFFDQAALVTPLLGVEADGLLFVVATWDMTVARKLFIDRKRGEMTALRRVCDWLAGSGYLVDPGAFELVDVGANIGTTTLPALGRIGFRRAV